MKLHTCMLRDLAKVSKQVDAQLLIAYAASEDDDIPVLRGIFGDRATYYRQAEGGLGMRMYEAIRFALDAGYEKVVLTGTDIPELSAEEISGAFDALDRVSLVFGPALDGGYYLVGTGKDCPEIFALEKYSHSKVLEQTLTLAREAGDSFQLISEKDDLDTPEDLRAYRKMAKSLKMQSAAARFAKSIQKISIVVPIYNEEKTISPLLMQLRRLKGSCEILLVDGGSSDATLELIGDEFEVLHSPKGRANQMNFGAEHSRGDVLFFLHCDSVLPDNALEEMKKVLKKRKAGCFGITFPKGSALMRICQFMSNLRAGCRGIVFGDQGLFIEREVFFEAGGFPAIPIMEDYQLSLTLRKMGVRFGMTKSRILTSDRRYPKGGMPKLKLMWKMHYLRFLYRRGEDIETIARLYRDVR